MVRVLEHSENVEEALAQKVALNLLTTKFEADENSDCITMGLYTINVNDKTNNSVF